MRSAVHCSCNFCPVDCSEFLVGIIMVVAGNLDLQYKLLKCLGLPQYPFDYVLIQPLFQVLRAALCE